MLVKINDENRHIMHRLQKAKSVYNAKKWEDEDRENKKMVKMISSNSGKFTKHPYFTPKSKFRDPLRIKPRTR